MMGARTSLLSHQISVTTCSCSPIIAFEEALGAGEALAGTSRRSAASGRG